MVHSTVRLVNMGRQEFVSVVPLSLDFFCHFDHFRHENLCNTPEDNGEVGVASLSEHSADQFPNTSLVESGCSESPVSMEFVLAWGRRRAFFLSRAV